MKQFMLSAMLVMVVSGNLFAGNKETKNDPRTKDPRANDLLTKDRLTNDPPKKGKTLVIVHGAWMAPYSWKTVKAGLEKKGESVVLVELRGHGDDLTPPQTLSINVYRDQVIAVIDSVGGTVILVGHSLAGMVISAVAESIPDKIEKLIYVACYLPASGQSLLDLANTDAQALLGPSLIPSADKLTLDVKHENIITIFCADAPPAIQKQVMDNFRVEPAIPFTNPVTLTAANFGKVNKYYIHTVKDHVISLDLQNRMVAAAGIAPAQVFSLESSHTPFFSMPDKLLELLMKISK